MMTGILRQATYIVITQDGKINSLLIGQIINLRLDVSDTKW